jgi:trehalose 6-phosphate synthase/phosphatase
MQRLLIVSNRLPVTVRREGDELQFLQSMGGLATGLKAFYQSYESLWIGWCGISLENIRNAEKVTIQERLQNEFACRTVFLSEKETELYYEGFCNKTIWPLFHYFTDYTVFSKRLWETYNQVNNRFCSVITDIARPDDIIWLHDYHLMLLPRLIRAALPPAKIGFFLHIPFPSYEVFRSLPWRKEVLQGLLGSDLVGFHTYSYVRHFLSSVRRILGYEHSLGNIYSKNRIIKVDAFPMGIDHTEFENAARDSKIQEEADIISKRAGRRKIILSIDRLDYTKGILQRLEAFDLFLENNPEYKEKVTLILCATPSRTGVETYKLLKRQLDEAVGRVNGKHGTIGWVPVWYMFRSSPFHTLIALYSIADVALITPLRDGMNLIAKEYVAAKVNGEGVLILSEMAGAASELGEALSVNPNNKEQVAEAIEKALSMSREEQIERNSKMQERIRRYNVTKWAEDFVETLSEVKKQQQKLYANRITLKMRKKLIYEYTEGKNRLLLLDYDGTLVSFAENPAQARPDRVLVDFLKRLCAQPETTVVIISGRQKETLERWFGTLSAGMVAEHGVWIKNPREPWEMIEPLRDTWKEDIRPILNLFVNRTPGSFLEEKEYSLVFHYRKTDPALASVRVSELKDALLNLTTHLNLGVLEGSRIVEIKNTGINKGRAAMRWLSSSTWDFILAAGDDWTDENLFEVLPLSAYSIKVGLGRSRARFNVGSVEEMRDLLKEISGR